MKNLLVTALVLLSAWNAEATDTKAKAADAAAAAQPVSSEPQATTANFGDWTLRCTRIDATAAAKKICEVVQSIGVQGQPNPLAQMAFGYEVAGGPLKFTAVLPTNITFSGPVGMASADPDPVSLPLAWTRCLPDGCFANTDVDKALLSKLRGETKPGKLMFKDGGGRDIALPVSFRGLSEALDALDKG